MKSTILCSVLVFCAVLAGIPSVRAQSSHDLMIAALRAALAEPEPLPARVASHDEMITAVRTAIAQSKCGDCCGTGHARSADHCAKACSCADHSICPHHHHAAQPAAPATLTPVATTREDRLRALTADYKAGLLTPTQYHAQRAALLGQP